MPAEVGVPGVGVDEVGARRATDHGQVDAHRLDRRVRRGQFSELGVCRGAGFVARLTEGMDLHRHVAARAQGTNELGDVDPRAAVDRWGIFLAEDVDAHGATLVRSAG